MWHRGAISLILPLLVIGLLLADIYYDPYRTSKMDRRLAKMRVNVELPKYKITDYFSDYWDGHVYTIEFKDDVKYLIPKLDSLCLVDSLWTKNGESYAYKIVLDEDGVTRTFSINPNNQFAEYRYLKW